MTYDNFIVSVSEKIATVSFNRPEKSNSLTLPMWQELKQVFQDVSAIPEARVVILKGEGKNFCAGMDLEAFARIPGAMEPESEERREKLEAFILDLQSTISAIEECRVPVIAAVHKACIGGGINIVSACDMRYCTDDAYFSIKEIDLGIVADIGVLQRLPTIINPSIVAELAYTGRSVFGPEAQEIGLVAKSYGTQEQLMEEVHKLAKMIASKSPLGIRGIKKMLLYKRDHTVADAMNEMARYNATHLISPDLAEAMMAYMAKKQPVFKD